MTHFLKHFCGQPSESLGAGNILQYSWEISKLVPLATLYVTSNICCIYKNLLAKVLKMHYYSDFQTSRNATLQLLVRIIRHVVL